MNIVIVGIACVSVVSGTYFAEMDIDVTCMDVNKEKINAIRWKYIEMFEEVMEEIKKK